MDIRKADILVHLNRKPDFLGKRIQEYQRAVGLTGDAVLATHIEIVTDVRFDCIRTGSQTFPTCATPLYGRADLEKALSGPDPSRVLLRLKNYDKWVTPPFIDALRASIAETRGKKPTGWASWLPKGFYNILGLPSYWWNYALHKIGFKKHSPIFNIPGGLMVCSEAGAHWLTAAFEAAWGIDPLFIEPDSEVCPGAFFVDPNIERVAV